MWEKEDGRARSARRARRRAERRAETQGGTGVVIKHHCLPCLELFLAENIVLAENSNVLLACQSLYCIDS
jgi:hypothetical protein